jgi:hypothetical protein
LSAKTAKLMKATHARTKASKTWKIPNSTAMNEEGSRFRWNGSRVFSRDSNERDRFLVSLALLRTCVESIVELVSSEGAVGG